MEAPKKVQIGLKINDYDDWEIQGYSFLEDKQAGMAEYTRTDAFIEKACENLKKLMYDNLMFQGRLHREEIINSFIEDFKKYMEGGEE